MRIFNYELLKKIKIDAETLSLISEIKELTDSGYIKKIGAGKNTEYVVAIK